MILYNQELLKPGISIKELIPQLWDTPSAYFKNRYTCVIHGVGMADEYPAIYDKQELDANLYCQDLILEPGMCLSVEAYIGEENGPVGVKMENQIVINENGSQILSDFPFEQDLMLL